jgi:hypothetical protein
MHEEGCLVFYGWVLVLYVQRNAGDEKGGDVERAKCLYLEMCPSRKRTVFI